MEEKRERRERAESDGILWVTASTDGALDTMREVERALLLAELGTSELLRGLAAVARSWPLDPDGFPKPTPGIRGRLVRIYRGLVRRFIWWHHREQLGEIADFHGLVNHSFQYLSRALAESEAARRADRERLEARIAELERRVGAEDAARDARPMAAEERR
ncbi:MAG: hypothetical protein KDB94_00010 [Acidobacteria bacterium]|nr:hypothetical protein [Acidobacteriota bacterium]